MEQVSVKLRRGRDSGGERFRPPSPGSLEEAGLTASRIEELVLKNLYFRGETSGRDLSKLLGIRFSLIEPVLDFLKRGRMIETKRSSSLGSVSAYFAPSDAGRRRAQEYLELNQLLGPAPVPLYQYVAAVKQQRIRSGWMSKDRLAKAFTKAIVTDDFYSRFGPAVNSFKSMLIYGKPGNGKSFLSEQLARLDSDAVYLPYHVEADGQIVKVFDPLYHQRVDSEEQHIFLTDEPEYDQRWVKCRRPFLTTGGELTMEMLDLMYIPSSKIYDAPYQLKANNGIYLVDDFGRQQISPAELLNRWIYPLDRGVDYLSFQTGSKIQVPFECFLIFSSNLNPDDLGDEAFLRRLEYKMFLKNPSREEYRVIFKDFCEQQELECPDDLLEALLEAVIHDHYEQTGRKFRRCHPRDVIRAAIDLIKFEKRPYLLTKELMDRAFELKFVAPNYGDE